MYPSLHIVTIMSLTWVPGCCTQRASLHAVTSMLRKLDLPVMINLIVDLNLAGVVQYSPLQFHAFAYAIHVQVIADRVQRLMTISLCVENLTLSSNIQII